MCINITSGCPLLSIKASDSSHMHASGKIRWQALLFTKAAIMTQSASSQPLLSLRTLFALHRTKFHKSTLLCSRQNLGSTSAVRHVLTRPGCLIWQVMTSAEADSYWCLCKLLDGIQDHYTHAQPGIQRTVFRLQELVRCLTASIFISFQIFMRHGSALGIGLCSPPCIAKAASWQV